MRCATTKVREKADYRCAVPDSAPLDDADSRRLLTYLAAALVAGGMPTHEVEQQVRSVAHRLGFRTAQVAATPTNVMVALETGEPATVEAIEGGLRLDQLAIANALSANLQTGRLSPGEGLVRLRLLRARPHRYNTIGLYGGGACAAIGIALILQPATRSVIFAALLSPVVVTFIQLAARFRSLQALLPSMAAFVVAFAAFLAAQHGLVAGPLRTLLPPLAVLLPGGLIVTGLSELAAGSMVAGTSRLTYGAAELLLFALGVGGAVALLHVPSAQMANTRLDDFGFGGAIIGVVLVTIGIALMEAVPMSLVPAVFVVIAATFGCQAYGQSIVHAPIFGAFLGAVAASFGAAVLELVRPQLSRIVVFLPSFWLLVPGSLGLLSVSQIGASSSDALATMMLTAGTIVAIALGVIVGSTGARGLRPITRRTRQREALKAPRS